MELILVKPKIKSLQYDEVNNVEKFEISPLEKNQAYGVFGNSLRKTLLEHIPGYAITNFKIGYRKSDDEEFTMKAHTFDTIPGVTPDLTSIFLSLKNGLFKLKGIKEKDITVTKKGPNIFKIGDFVSEDVIILNPELELFELVDENIEVTMTIKIKEGRGYKEESAYDIKDWLSIDAIFTPVVKVTPEVEEMRVNGEDGFERLFLTIKTNGKLTPKESLDIATRIILEGFTVLRDGTVDVIENESIYFEVQEEEVKIPVTYKNIKELDLSVRAKNALSAFGINNTNDFEKYTEKQIKAIENLGRKTFDEIKKKLEEYNIELKK